MWDNVIDTVLNIEVFAFIGIMVWLYFKETPEEDVTAERQEGSNERPADR